MDRYLSVIVSVVTIASGIGACTSESGENSAGNLASFAGSDCKKHGTDDTFGLTSLYTLPSANAYAGLNCISWQQSSTDAIAVDLLNFEGGCGVTWVGDAVSTETDRLHLTVTNPPPSGVASCGWCIYDWSFTATNVDIAGNLHVNIVVDTQPEQDDDDRIYNAILETSRADEGIQCRYAHWFAVQDQTMALGTAGALHMVCLENDTCEGDLICKDVSGDNRPICVAPCNEDSDCPLSQVLSCQTGACMIRTPWQPGT